MRRMLAAILGSLLAAGCTSGGSDSPATPPAQAPTSSTPTSSATPTVAVLGNPKLFRKGIGWGTVRPSRLTMGETGGRYYLIHSRLGELDSVQWTDWGGAEARATAVRAAWRAGGGYYKAPVRVEVRVWDLADCARWGYTGPAYTRMAIRVAAKPGAPVLGQWRDWPLYNLK